MQFGVAEVLGDPFFVSQRAEQGMGTTRRIGFQPGEIFSKPGEPFLEWNLIDPGGAAGHFGNSGAGPHGFVEEHSFHGTQHDAGDERHLERHAVVAVIDPRGEMAEVLAGAPVAESAEFSLLFGDLQLVDVGEDLIDGIEMEGAALWNSCGVGGHGGMITGCSRSFQKARTYAHNVALHFMHYNYCRIHQTLRVTPSMQAGLMDHVWEIVELVALLD